MYTIGFQKNKKNSQTNNNKKKYNFHFLEPTKTLYDGMTPYL